MAAYYSPFLLLSIFVAFYLLLLSSTNVTLVKATSFDFTQFKSGEKQLIFQGDAVVDDKNRCLVLTREEGGLPVQNSVGRVLYETSVHLWDRENGLEASFKTSFTFYNYRANKYPADGLAFFLTYVGSAPGRKVAGGLLGIFNDLPLLNKSNDLEKVVAVEFDSFSNVWDPKDPHIGIDVQSITSRITKPWPLKNDYVTVSITYEPFHGYEPFYGLLNVSSFYRQNPTDVYTLSLKVNLKDYLNEYVHVGLSATTGDLVEQHRVYSWSFSSEFPPTPPSSENLNLLTNQMQEE